MMQLTIAEQIMALVKVFGVVKRRQIEEFFNDPNYAPADVSFAISSLLANQMLFRHDNDILCLRHMPHVNFNDFAERLDSVECLLREELRASNVKELYEDDFPSEYGFITSNEMAYDVTVLTPFSWAVKQHLIKRAWERRTSSEEEDIVKHIAVSRDMATLIKAGKAGFDLFLHIAADGTRTLYEKAD